MEITANIHETNGRSVTVGLPKEVPMSFEIENTRRELIALRVKYGAESPIGHRCSNIVELLKKKPPPTELIKRQMAELQALLAAQ